MITNKTLQKKYLRNKIPGSIKGRLSGIKGAFVIIGQTTRFKRDLKIGDKIKIDSLDGIYTVIEINGSVKITVDKPIEKNFLDFHGRKIV
jgi:hypothetical protein